MATVEQALALAAQGFHVFPLVENSKLPAIANWQNEATTDPDRVRALFCDPVMGWDQGYNIGICTTRFKDQSLLVIDVDNKNGKNGHEELFRLELEGHELPPTRTHATPTGGQHLIYSVPRPVSNGVDVLARGLDIRSDRGFIVAPGSTVAAGEYRADHPDFDVEPAPGWVIDRCSAAKERPAEKTEKVEGINQEAAIARAIDYLARAPIAYEGNGGDLVTYKVACQLKDFGVDELHALALMADHWNANCEPPWPQEELEAKVSNAYRYGNEPVGASAPEAQFPVVQNDTEQTNGKLHPFDELNKEYAYVLAGGTGNILWETTDSNGAFAFHLFNKTTVADKLAAKKITVGKKPEPLFTAWMEWNGRRTYDGLVFEPGLEVDPRWYNMWRGFAVKPADHPNHPMVERWKEHLLQNICQSNAYLADWLTCWFAHLIQRPWEKPLVAVVFKGTKGTGKNALVERVKYLLGGHGMVTSRRRYLVSNFTMHLQKCLVFILDEAFWSGDKEAEGVVKDLVTGSEHDIEPKGKESYRVRNLTRVVVIGNEEWLVPASADERRWAVFELGEGKKQQREYFEEMRVGLDEEGGAAHLLRYLLDYKIGQNINQAPSTAALLDQKLSSLEPMQQWWYESLSSGRIEGSDFDGWPKEMEKARLRDALYRWWDSHRIKSRRPSEVSIGKQFKKFAPGVKADRPMRQGVYHQIYVVGTLDEMRTEWEKFMGQKVEW